MSANTFDVIIVGAGPVGLALGRMLGLRGHDVAILERWSKPYPLPRAVHFDDEIGRVFQSMGMADQVKAVSEPVPDYYEWRNAAGEALLRIDWSGTGPCGWPTASFFSQPQLENVLALAIAETPTVTLRRGAEVVGADDRGDHVEVTLRSESGDVDVLRGRFVVGCDGANSFIRQHIGTAVHDEGFFFDWLIVDTIPLDDGPWSPQNWQLCDPARPTTVVSGGPGRRRWEFMRLPEESIEDLNTPERAWELLKAWGRTPANTELERHCVYTFAARWAESWNRGRVAIAGDAAHLMPPFAGQGMCSGLRDAANLSWKLDRVLRGESTIDLLDSYTSERQTHIQHAIAMSVELGRVICVLDEQHAAERDARMIAGGADPARVLPVAALPVLGTGVTADHIDLVDLRGTLAPQFPVVRQGNLALLDDAIGYGAVLLVRGVDDRSVSLDPCILVGSGLQVLSIGPEGNADLHDATGLWAQWFDQHAISAALIRPDHYIFGAVATADRIQALVSQYRDRIRTTSEAKPQYAMPNVTSQ